VWCGRTKPTTVAEWSNEQRPPAFLLQVQTKPTPLFPLFFCFKWQKMMIFLFLTHFQPRGSQTTPTVGKSIKNASRIRRHNAYFPVYRSCYNVKYTFSTIWPFGRQKHSQQQAVRICKRGNYMYYFSDFENSKAGRPRGNPTTLLDTFITFITAVVPKLFVSYYMSYFTRRFPAKRTGGMEDPLPGTRWRRARCRWKARQKSCGHDVLTLQWSPMHKCYSIKYTYFYGLVNF